MARNPERTRKSIMDSAEELILQYGFSGTTVSAVIEKAGVTKGAFFHHFDTKVDLGHALVERYAALDAEHLERTMTRAERLSRDPLQQLLIFIDLLKEEMDALTQPYPGCLFASYCYQAGLFDEKTLEVAREAMRNWRDQVGEKLREAAARHSIAANVDPDSVAGMLLNVLEGSFVLSKALGDPRVVAEQLGHYRNYVELLFAAKPAPTGHVS